MPTINIREFTVFIFRRNITTTKYYRATSCVRCLEGEYTDVSRTDTDTFLETSLDRHNHRNVDVLTIQTLDAGVEPRIT